MINIAEYVTKPQAEIEGDLETILSWRAKLECSSSCKEGGMQAHSLCVGPYRYRRGSVSQFKRNRILK